MAEVSLIEAFQKNLIATRKKMGMNQKDLAGILGLSRQSLSAIENGKVKMTRVHYLAILSAFHIWNIRKESIYECQK